MDSLLTIGVSNAAAVAVLSVVLIPLARWLRRPALTHAVCVLLLLKLVTPPVFTLPLHWLPSGTAGGAEPRAATVAVHQESLPAPPEPAAIAGDVDPPDPADEVPIGEGDAIAPLPPAPAEPAPAPVPVRPTPRPAPFQWTRAIALAWLIAAGLCAAMIAVRLLQLRRFLRSAVIAPDDVQAHARLLASRLGLHRPPPVLFVPGRPCPMLLAVFTAPRLLVPRQLWDRLGPEQRQTLLLHELAHLRRRDHWVRCLELVVTVLYWWHPSAWWARVTLREAEEQCCDAWVVWAMPGAVRTYMATLLDAVDFLCEPDTTRGGRPSHSPRPEIPATPMLASGMGQFHCLERRLTMVKYQAVRRRLSRRGFAAVVGVAALLPLTPTLAQQQQPAEPTPVPPTPSVAPVKILPNPVVAPVNAAADDQDSPRNDRTDAKPVPASADRQSSSSSSSSSRSSNGSRDDEVAQLRKELEQMRAQLRAYEQQLRAARDAERAARDAERSAREGRETRTAPRSPVPVPPTPDARGQIRTGAVPVPAAPNPANADNTSSITTVPGGEVRTVTRDGVTYRELVLSQPGQPDLKGRVVVRSADNEVQGLDRETGKVLWDFRMAPDAKVNAVDVAGGIARIRLSDGKTLQLDVPTGKAVDGAGSNNLFRAAPSSRADNNQEKRLKSLEDKLDRLMKEVERMNQNRGGDRDRDRDRDGGEGHESKPRTSQGPARS